MPGIRGGKRMAMQFEFATATRIIFGPGTVRQAASVAKGLGGHPLVVTGRDTRRAEPLLTDLRRQDLRPATFAVSGEPEVETITMGLKLAKEKNCDLVISFGGGSALDAGKAIAAMLTNQGELLDFLEVIGGAKPLAKPSAPFIAIPTTAGTGSEVTRNAVIGSPQQRVKVSLRSPLMLPKVALVDPELTLDLPPAITAATGLDALTQLIEPYVCSRANPMTDALCVEGIPRAARSLRAAYKDGHNTAAREDMSLASLFGGFALANAGLGAVHGFAGPIGGMFPAPHGAICATLLPYVMQGNLRALRSRQSGSETLRRYEHVARLLTGKDGATADDGVGWVRRLAADLQIPRLASYGITPQHVTELVEKALQSSSMKANPIVLTTEELSEILAEEI